MNTHFDYHTMCNVKSATEQLKLCQIRKKVIEMK